MMIHVALELATLAAVAVLYWYVCRNFPSSSRTEPEIAMLEPAAPMAAVVTPPRDTLADFAAELNFTALTAEGAAEHRLELLAALLREAEHETTRMELLVDKLGQHLVRGSHMSGSAFA